MDKWIGCNPKNQLEVDMWHERIILLTQLDPTGWDGGKEKKKEEKKEDKVFRERVSNFSLDFRAIGPAASGETREKVDPHCKSYAWVPVLWSFDNSKR